MSDSPPDNRLLLILAVDHRASLEHDPYDLTGPPTPAHAAQISADKLLVYQALLDAAGQLPAEVQPGILVDEQYGAGVAELAARSGDAVSLCMPIEASGQDWFGFAYGDDWQQHAGFFAPGHTLAVMEYLRDRGVDPAIWAVEGLDRHDDAVAVAATAGRGGRRARCVVLGRHAPREDLEHWLQVAAPIPGWTGFAIGRSIWQAPLHAHLHHYCTAGQARRRIAAAYLDYGRHYLSAREGTLTEPKPVL
jgi:myo-inositol catabolism protein IolC